MTCTKCGAEGGEGRFCAQCGQPLQPAAAAYETEAIPEDGLAEPPRGQWSAAKVLVLILAGALVVVVAVVGAVLLFRESSTTAVVTTTPTPTVARSQATTTSPSSTPSRSVSSSPSVSRSPSTTSPTPTGAPTDFGGVDCGSGVTAVGPTSCPFALAVRTAYLANSGAPFVPGVESPVTGVSYDMKCTVTDSIVRCTGGDGAEVVFRN